MRLTKVPRYTVADLERRAEALLRERCGWPPPLPVDVELLVDREPGVLLDILPGLQGVCGVAGLHRYEPKQDRIRILSGVTPPSPRPTVRDGRRSSRGPRRGIRKGNAGRP